MARVDLAWPKQRVAGDYDGQWHADPGQLHRDRARLRALNQAGWVVYSVTRQDMRDLPRVAREITRGGGEPIQFAWLGRPASVR